MSKTLTAIAEQLRDANKKVQLIYAFNGTGKTRLSRAFKALIAPKAEGEEAQASDLAEKKILYYSAFTEDLFYWQNDLERDVEPKLIIQPNAFTLFNDWKQWAELSGEYIGTQRRFSDALLARRFEKWRNSMGVRGYQGIDLKQPTSLPARSYPYNDD